MVYFFHHYELPAILQQARIQHLLAHGGGAGNQASNASNVTTNQNAATQNAAVSNTPPGGNSTANQNSQTEVIQNGQIPNQTQSTIEVDGDSVLTEEDFIDLSNLQTTDTNEGQQVLGDIELSAILQETLNQTLNVAAGDLDENLIMQSVEDSDDDILLNESDINHSELTNNSPHQPDCGMENSSRNFASGTESCEAVSSCDTQSLSINATSFDPENAVSNTVGVNENIESVSAIVNGSSVNSVSGNDRVRFRGRSEQNGSASNHVIKGDNENSGTEV